MHCAATKLCCLLAAATAPALVDASTSRAQAAEAGRALLHCRVTDNGAASSGTMRLRGLSPAATPTLETSCGSSVGVAAGEYEVAVQLDGALDRPEKRQQVKLRAGENRLLAVDFTTASLTVTVEAQGKRAAGMVQVVRAGKAVGQVGAGVPMRLSEGEYSVVARYRDQPHAPVSVRLAARENRQLQIQFP